LVNYEGRKFAASIAPALVISSYT